LQIVSASQPFSFCSGSPYCRIPFRRQHSRAPEIIELAKLLGRSPESVALKLNNFSRLDPELKARGIKGMPHGAKGEIEVWRDFENNPEAVASESVSVRGNFHCEIAKDGNSTNCRRSFRWGRRLLARFSEGERGCR